MPKSRVRKKKSDLYVAPPEVTGRKKKGPSPAWFGPLVLAIMLAGVAWLVVYYTTEGRLPVESLDAWNVVVGFGFIASGFALSTQWR